MCVYTYIKSLMFLYFQKRIIQTSFRSNFNTTTTTTTTIIVLSFLVARCWLYTEEGGNFKKRGGGRGEEAKGKGGAGKEIYIYFLSTL